MARFSSPLGGAGLLSLCLWLSGCWAVWRYRTSTGYYFIFSTRTTLYLEYDGTLFQEWDVPLLCIVTNRSSPTTTLRCPVPGTHKIKPVVRRATFEDMERYLSINVDVNCFMWYTYLYQEAEDRLDPLGFSDKQDVISWIVDPENAGKSELNYTATSPSPYSQVLSKEYWNLGQRPVVKTLFHKIHYTSTAFPEQGIWKIKVPTTTGDMTAYIYGRTITFEDCFVVATPAVIAYSRIFLQNAYDVSISSPAGSNIMVSWSECFPTSAVLVTDVATFYTNDGFITSKEIKFPSSIIDVALIHSVKEVAVFFDHFMILIGDVVYKIEERGISRLGEDVGLPESGIIGIRSRTWCPFEYPELNNLSDKIVWTTDTVYLQSRNRWYTFLTNTTLLKAFLNFQPRADISILEACFDSLPNEITLLIECNRCAPTRVLYLVAVNELTDTWLLRDFSLNASVINMEVLYSASTSMMLWADDKVYYTYRGNKVYGYLKVSDGIFSAASERSTIHQVLIDHDGNTIIKLKNNVMFFLKFEMTDAVKLAAWQNETINFALYWIIAGTTYLLIVDGHHIYRQTYPLKTEVFSAIFLSQEFCPYISFEANVNSNVYYVDKRQNVAFWAEIVFPENLGLYTEIIVYKPALLKQKADLRYEIARGICTKNQTTTFYHEQDYLDESDYYNAVSKSIGIMTVEMKPSSFGKTCVSRNMLFHIQVGCPPFRHLVVDRPSSCNDQNFTFTIPKEYTWFKTTKDLTIHYDKEMFGCPFDVHYADPFRPLVMLYDGDRLINIVESEYVLWEINGRTDFFYNATMKEAHCVRYAQNWHSMISKDHDQDLTFEEIDEIWGPHNYKSCFKFERASLRNIHEPYEILNHSGINSLIWSKYHTGIYLFRLRILDPNFSFCDLSAYFAVRTYGILERPSGLKVAVFAVSLVTLFVAVLVFSYFKYVKIFQTLSFVNPHLHAHNYATTSADELPKEK